MNSKAVIDEFSKLPPEEKLEVRDFVLTDGCEQEHIIATLKERAKGASIPFDPADESFFQEIRSESERMLDQENA